MEDLSQYPSLIAIVEHEVEKALFSTAEAVGVSEEILQPIQNPAGTFIADWIRTSLSLSNSLYTFDTSWKDSNEAVYNKAEWYKDCLASNFVGWWAISKDLACSTKEMILAGTHTIAWAFLLITAIVGLLTQVDYRSSDGFLLYYHSWVLIGLTWDFFWLMIFSFVKIFYEEVYVLVMWLLVLLGVTQDQITEANKTLTGESIMQPSAAFLIILQEVYDTLQVGFLIEMADSFMALSFFFALLYNGRKVFNDETFVAFVCILPVVISSIEFWFNRTSLSEDDQAANTVGALIPAILYLILNAFFQNFILVPLPMWSLWNNGNAQAIEIVPLIGGENWDSFTKMVVFVIVQWMMYASAATMSRAKVSYWG